MKKRINKNKTTTNKKTEEKQKRDWHPLLFIRDYIYSILYVVMLIVLWIYVIYNWDICISMQFFSQFDGNNILFIVGLVLVIIPFYDIEGKGIRLRRRSTKSLEDKLQNADSTYQYEMLMREAAKLQSEKLNKSDGGDGEEWTIKENK